jgi:hypothetical protein
MQVMPILPLALATEPPGRFGPASGALEQEAQKTTSKTEHKANRRIMI